MCLDGQNDVPGRFSVVQCRIMLMSMMLKSANYHSKHIHTLLESIAD